MALYKMAFSRNDKERFDQFLQDVKAGKVTIKAEQMMPHELVKQYIDNPNASDDVTELQWKSLVDSVLKSISRQ